MIQKRLDFESLALVPVVARESLSGIPGNAIISHLSHSCRTKRFDSVGKGAQRIIFRKNWQSQGPIELSWVSIQRDASMLKAAVKKAKVKYYNEFHIVGVLGLMIFNQIYPSTGFLFLSEILNYLSPANLGFVYIRF